MSQEDALFIIRNFLDANWEQFSEFCEELGESAEETYEATSG
ncbi:hypothetical protein PhAPEC5_29 [Escherichia phage vB_EcoP_PhAPEC5]|uniref:Uncharacterized protein n=1 Tax=Escherichia phage vB_EcoP_PhAPEC5 TaxID=1395983 RepID=A0A067Y145_9CAUD|nr:hypothetical protein LD33_gp32 [Escherichia phage vB_EcoP_PhAPEC5]AGV99311.1 hypothetical protein PhAPEC5_29 [Escherichia phage vB_EcoP_PhAPEC5]UUB18086.1 hypothetical protein [Escherichia phage ST4]